VHISCNIFLTCSNSHIQRLVKVGYRNIGAVLLQVNTSDVFKGKAFTRIAFQLIKDLKSVKMVKKGVTVISLTIQERSDIILYDTNTYFYPQRIIDFECFHVVIKRSIEVVELHVSAGNVVACPRNGSIVS